MVSLAEIDEIALKGGIVLARDGETIGSVEQIFTSEDSGEPVFVTVRTGLFGMSESFVPLAGSTVDGTRITVSYAKAVVKNGPRIESDRGTITTAEESMLFDYFGLTTTAAATHEGTPASSQARTAETGDWVAESREHAGAIAPAAGSGEAVRQPAHPDHPRPGPHPGGPPPHLLKHVPLPRPGSAPPSPNGPHPRPHP